MRDPMSSLTNSQQKSCKNELSRNKKTMQEMDLNLELKEEALHQIMGEKCKEQWKSKKSKNG